MDAKALAEFFGNLPRQIGVITHSPTINVDNWEDAARLEGLSCIRDNGHTRLYRINRELPVYAQVPIDA